MAEPQKRRSRLLGMAGVAWGTGLVAFLVWSPSGPAPIDARVPTGLVQSPTARRQTPPVAHAAGLATALPAGEDVLGPSFAKVSSANSPEAARAVIEGLGRAIRGRPAETLGLELRRFLDQRLDRETGLEFRVGPKGRLWGWPTFRVALLDFWGQSDLPGAAAYAPSILARHDSADEWAVCLRNLAWHSPDPARDAYLRGRTADLLAYVPWAEHPTRGYLEAYDLVVATRQVDLAHTLGNRLSEPRVERLQWACRLTLDRLALAAPAELYDALLAHPRWLDSTPLVRADLFARADVADPGQERAVQAYLAGRELGGEELGKFVATFPLCSQAVSDNLVTAPAVPSLAKVAVRDRAALGVVEAWLAAPALEPHRQDLERLRMRLRQFVASAQRGGV